MNDEIRKLLGNLKEGKQETLHKNSKVLLIDSLNTFLRNFVKVNHMNRHGNHIGGLSGFLKSIGYAIREIKPTRVILVFDGQGSSTTKKYLYPEYKANRKVNKISNWDGYENVNEESEAIKNQALRLIDYLRCLPVDLLSVDKIEADDVIGYITQKLDYDSLYIMSTDQDYLQLVNNKVTVYSPSKRIFYTPEVLVRECGITPQNYLIKKVILGDVSDNVPKVGGIGEKTLIKLFPELGENRVVELSEIIAKAKENLGKYTKIYEFRHQLEINRQLMDLASEDIPEWCKDQIKEILKNPSDVIDKIAFMGLYIEDCLDHSIPNVAYWLHETFDYLIAFKPKI